MRRKNEAPPKANAWQHEYLWHREREAGKDTVRKSRPAALPTTYVGKDGRINLFWIPITGKEPRKDRLAIEVPQIERKHAGLASDMRLWVTADEYNHEFLETSFHIDPNGYQGVFSAAFADKAPNLLVEARKMGRLNMVRRPLREGWRMPRNPGSTDDRRRRSIKCSESNCISRRSKFGWNRGGRGSLRGRAGFASSRLRRVRFVRFR